MLNKRRYSQLIKGTSTIYIKLYSRYSLVMRILLTSLLLVLSQQVMSIDCALGRNDEFVHNCSYYNNDPFRKPQYKTPLALPDSWPINIPRIGVDVGLKIPIKYRFFNLVTILVLCRKVSNKLPYLADSSLRMNPVP